MRSLDESPQNGSKKSKISIFSVFLYKIFDLLNTEAELGQYFLCKHNFKKIPRFNGGL